MTPTTRARLASARELLLVGLVGHALDALERALLVEHPALDDATVATAAVTTRRARTALRAAHRLRVALAAYTRAVDDALAHDDRGFTDLPF